MSGKARALARLIGYEDDNLDDAEDILKEAIWQERIFSFFCGILFIGALKVVSGVIFGAAKVFLF